ncbi:uncharacterized protein LOC122849379 [Aphidius gifuensis]|uniref:uncharacterized protein LOC122849379 n=1 Tax=Aphidius gifuensis TaxID=684658 RepID=UPI001CDCBFFF|nr:uncharacterized protein LOC122849379 [Aphidius gifuensis]
MKSTGLILTFFLVFFVSLNVIQAEKLIFREIPGQLNMVTRVPLNSGYKNLSSRTIDPATADSGLIDILSSYRLPSYSKFHDHWLLLDGILNLMESTPYLTKDDKTYIFQVIETTLRKDMIEKILDTINDVEKLNKLSVENKEILFNKTKDAVTTIMYTSNDLNKMYKAMHTWVANVNTEENVKTIGRYLIPGFDKAEQEMFYPESEWNDLCVTVETKIKSNMFKMYNDEVNKLIKKRKTGLNVIQADFPGPLEHPVCRGIPGQLDTAVPPYSGYQNLSRRTMKSATADSELIDMLSSYRLPADARLYGQYLLLDNIFDLMKSSDQ